MVGIFHGELLNNQMVLEPTPWPCLEGSMNMLQLWTPEVKKSESKIMWWNQVHGMGVGSTSFPKTSCRRNAWNSRSVKPLALWIYSTAILTFRRIHAREFVELVWTCILIKRDEPPKSMKENGLQKIQGCAFLQFSSACDVTNWKLKRWSAHTWQIL